MRFLSVCSGIEAASVAWNPIGWRAAALSEIEPFPSAVLAHHYPSVPNLGDMTKFQEWPDLGSIDLLCGGTPCQSFSVAGLRTGLADPRGDLMLTFGAIAAKHRPRWLVWENVPGVLSSNGGGDFGAFLGLLGLIGYGFAYRVLDAQYFGLAQRRKRVFVVGCLGDWRSAAAVLFERNSLSGNPAPSRQAGQGTAGRALCSTDGGIDREDRHNLIVGALCNNGKAAGSATNQDAESGYLVTHSLTGEGFDASEDGTGRGTPLVPIGYDMQNGALTGDLSATLQAEGQRTGNRGMAVMAHAPAIGFDRKASGQNGFGVGEIASTQRAMGHANSHTNGGGHQAAMVGMQVRRLTPRECERLQGFPDDYTLVPHRSKPAADGPRYKALGNSWAVPNVRWIGRRIEMVESVAQREAA